MCLAVAVIFAAVPAAAQSGVTVKLKLVEENSGEPVPFATVSLTPKGQTKAKHYVLTDAQGAASIAKVAKGEYRLKAEIMGYKSYEKDVVIDKTVDFGDVKMSEDIEVLDAAKVTAVGNPIVVKRTPSSTMPPRSRPRTTTCLRNFSRNFLASRFPKTAQ